MQVGDIMPGREEFCDLVHSSNAGWDTKTRKVHGGPSENREVFECACQHAFKQGRTWVGAVAKFPMMVDRRGTGRVRDVIRVKVYYSESSRRHLIKKPLSYLSNRYQAC